MGYGSTYEIVKERLETATFKHFFPGFGDNMAERNLMWVQTLTNGAIDTFYGQSMLPANFAVGGNPTYIRSLLIIGADTGNIRSDTEVEYGTLGESEGGNNASSLDSVDAVSTANVLWFSDVLTLAEGVAANDHISAKFRRESDSAQDTVEVDCYGVGFMLTYTGYV